MSDLEKAFLSQTEPIDFELLRLIIDSTTDAIFLKDTQFRYLLINNAGAAFIGKPVKEILGNTDFDLLPREVALRTTERDRLALATGEIQSYDDTEEIEGRLRTFHTTKSVYRDKSGKIQGIFGIAREITPRKEIEADRERLIVELQTALNEIKTLKETLPICMHCRKIRDDKGAWTELEAYIQANTNSEFSHGLCKDCYKENYPEFYAKKFPDEELVFRRKK